MGHSPSAQPHLYRHNLIFDRQLELEMDINTLQQLNILSRKQTKYCRKLTCLYNHSRNLFTSCGTVAATVKKLRICLAVLTQYRRVTDRQTDGRTDGHLATA